MVTKQREREDKYAVGQDFLLPDLAELAGAGGRLETATFGLTNLYHDTAGADLWRAGLTLRRRTGGPDAGWQLKLPSGPARTEIGSRARSRTVPAALADAVLGLTRGQPLTPVAELSTTRSVTRLLDAEGRLRAEVADDRVSSTTLGDEARLDHWREVEVELGEAGDEDLLAVIGKRLVAAGAEPAGHASKLARALGLATVQQEDRPPLVTVADVVTRYVREQGEEILRGDLALRLGEPRVHKTRVAIRRLRSTVRVYADLFDPEPVARLEEELTWLASLLGEVRDREVLLERLQGQVAELPAELVLGPVAADLDRVLSGERQDALRAVHRELASSRALDLLEALTRWRTEPPFLESASASAGEVKAYVRAAGRTMRRRLKQARQQTGPAQEELLHRARKAGKRARYAAELALPAWPKAAQQVTEAQELQTVLGEHQDSVVAAAFLRRMGAETGARAGRNGFTYGVLLAREWERAAAVRRELAEHQG